MTLIGRLEEWKENLETTWMPKDDDVRRQASFNPCHITFHKNMQFGRSCSRPQMSIFITLLNASHFGDLILSIKLPQWSQIYCLPFTRERNLPWFGLHWPNHMLLSMERSSCYWHQTSWGTCKISDVGKYNNIPCYRDQNTTLNRWQDNGVLLLVLESHLPSIQWRSH